MPWPICSVHPLCHHSFFFHLLYYLDAWLVQLPNPLWCRKGEVFERELNLLLMSLSLVYVLLLMSSSPVQNWGCKTCQKMALLSKNLIQKIKGCSSGASRLLFVARYPIRNLLCKRLSILVVYWAARHSSQMCTTCEAMDVPEAEHLPLPPQHHNV